MEKYEIKDLKKITRLNHSYKTLIFRFHNATEKKSYSFSNKKEAEECLSKVTSAFKSWKNKIMDELI